MERSQDDLVQKLRYVEERQRQRFKYLSLATLFVTTLVILAMYFAFSSARLAAKTRADAAEAKEFAEKISDQANKDLLQNAVEIREVEETLMESLRKLEESNSKVKEVTSENEYLRRQLSDFNSAVVDIRRKSIESIIDSLSEEMIQITVLQGDFPKWDVGENAIFYSCGEHLSSEQLQKSAPDGYSLAKLDRVATIGGGMCGYVFYSATFLPDTL